MSINSPVGEYVPQIQTSPTVMGYSGVSVLGPGYIYAPYIPLVNPVVPMTDAERAARRREIREVMRIPAGVIKASMKQAGYKLNKDFEVHISDNSATIHVYTVPGRRFTEGGVCQVHMNKGKLNVFWTYDPTPPMGGKAHAEVDIVLADPDCFTKVAETILKATKACPVKISPYHKPVDSSLYGKVTI